MAKKANIKKQIKEAQDVLKEVMRDNLADIGADLIAQVVARLKSLPESRRFDALAGLEPVGVLKYKQALQTALALIAADAIAQARKEIPKAKNVKLAELEPSLKLGEFEKLPPDIRARIQRFIQALVGKQTADLVGAVNFQFQHSVDTTDSLATIESDLSDEVGSYVEGNSVDAGAGVAAAQTVNEARNAFFYDEETLQEIDAFIFTNGDPVSEICTALAGTVFSKDDPDAARYQPPLHFNCKSYIVPVLKGNLNDALKKAGQDDVEKLDPPRSAKDSIQFHEHVCCGHDH